MSSARLVRHSNAERRRQRIGRASQDRRGRQRGAGRDPGDPAGARTIRPKYACRDCTDGVVQAKVLPRLIESGMASTALVTHVVVSKFA